MEIADMWPKFSKAPKIWKCGCRVCCGGGEPLLNPHIEEFINRLHHNGIKVGLITTEFYWIK